MRQGNRPALPPGSLGRVHGLRIVAPGVGPIGHGVFAIGLGVITVIALRTPSRTRITHPEVHLTPAND